MVVRRLGFLPAGSGQTIASPEIAGKMLCFAHSINETARSSFLLSPNVSTTTDQLLEIIYYIN